MTRTQIIAAAKKLGFEYYEDTTGHYQLLAPGVRVRGMIGCNAGSGIYSEGVTSSNPLYLHTQVIVDLLNGKNPKEMIETDANAMRQEIIRKIAAI